MSRKPVKVLIHGSSVSRDALDYRGADRCLQLAGYFARSSLATLAEAPFTDEGILERIASSAQRRMVRADMEKSFLTSLDHTEYDILLIDLIDERFNLLEMPGGGLVTLSNEYLSGAERPLHGRIIRSGSFEYVQKWHNGVRKLMECLDARSMRNKIRVNEVYWAMRIETGEALPGYFDERIEAANAFLRDCYRDLRTFLPESAFMVYAPELFVADSTHKWGVSPFNFVSALYDETITLLLAPPSPELQNKPHGDAFPPQIDLIDKEKTAQDLQLVAEHGSVATQANYHVLKLGVFNPVTLNLPIDWGMDPFFTRNWKHSFMSLRWLKGISDLDKIYNIMLDFHHYHLVKKDKNPYYNEIQGDHTISIRVSELVAVRERYEKNNHLKGVELSDKLIEQDIINLMSESLYRQGHNHGLMVDTALMNCYLLLPSFRHLINIDYIILRAINTISKMFDKSGVTKEHSISYQEYNMSICYDFGNLLAKIKKRNVAISSSEKFFELLQAIKTASKQLLGFSLKDDGNYFPIGDSFRRPAISILKKCFDSSQEDPKLILSPYSEKKGLYFSPLGFAIFRCHSIEKPLLKVHLFFTCGWHSSNHKQNDELSFCLDINGEKIFDDPGYTELLPNNETTSLRSEEYHSTITIEGRTWSPMKTANSSSRIINCQEYENEIIIEAEHKRIKNVILHRSIRYNKINIILIRDSVNSEHLLGEMIAHKFVLGPSIDVLIMGNCVKLSLGAEIVAKICVENEVHGSWITDEIIYIPVNRAKAEKTKILIFQRKYPEGQEVLFKLVMYPKVFLEKKTPSQNYALKLKQIERKDFGEFGANFIRNRMFSIGGFSEIFLDNDFDWHKDPFHNRTWQWHLHQLSFIIKLIAYDRINNSMEGSFLAIAIVKSWSDSFANDFSNNNAWHDHGTALRARNLLLLLSHYLDTGSDLKNINELLIPLLIIHAKKLSDADFYSKATNHGLDQSIVLFELAHELKDVTETGDWLRLAVERINFEIKHAFAADGGHVENSAAYLNYGIKQATEALAVGRAYEGDSSTIAMPAGMLEKATCALTFMTRPDGKLPLIGDTADFLVGDHLFREIKPENYPEFLYAIRSGKLAKQGTRPLATDLVLDKSGWAIFRSAWPAPPDLARTLHLVFKCGFLSTYHRHDDDLSFVLHHHGEDWLIDGGLYKYAPTDPYRIYFRSADAHNLSVPYGGCAQRSLALAAKTGIKGHGTDGLRSFVAGESHMFKGFISTRRLEYDRTTETISIRDRMQPHDADAERHMKERAGEGLTTYLTRFIVPTDKVVGILPSGCGCAITGKEDELLIETDAAVRHIDLIRGQVEPEIKGWVSYRANELEEAIAVEFHHQTPVLDATFTLRWA